MGDLINNFDIFKKLGFDSSNHQWIFYDERFQKFFNFFAENVGDANILSEHEVLERDELMDRGEYLEDTKRHTQLVALERHHPGLLHSSGAAVTSVTQEIELLERTEEAYAALLENMRTTKHNVNSHVSRLEDSINELVDAEKAQVAACQTKAKQFEELQRENLKLCKEVSKCFTQNQSPPLFFHQLPLDQYFLKCDSFMQYFSLYMKENFKIQEYMEMETSNIETQDIAANLEDLGKSIKHYTLGYLKEKAKANATEALIAQLDISQIHIISVADMERETHELELLNEHHLKSTYETLMHDLVMHVQQHTQQRMELVLYENTKQKLERALKRHENDKCLAKIISDALSNAELVWIIIQLDMERSRNRYDNTEQLAADTEACWRRIKAMQSLAVPAGKNNSCCAFVERIAEQLSQHLGVQHMRSETKACLYEYEKFCRLLTYALNGLLNKKCYAATLEQLTELDRLELILKPFVYDSPVAAPMFEHVRLLKPIFHARMQQERIEKRLRSLRNEFQEHITDRMANDKFWRYSQLLWIWFLTEPKRLLFAIEEVKRSASKVPALTGAKTLSGIKRK